VERSEWIAAKRRLAEQRMDTLFAPIYDDDWGASISPTHQRCMQRFLELCPPQSLIRDAGCGRG